MRLQPHQGKGSAAHESRRQGAPLREVFAYLALTGCALAFLWHFANIWLHGVTQAAEPNLVIRSFETVLFSVLLVLGIERMITAIRKGGRG